MMLLGAANELKNVHRKRVRSLSVTCPNAKDAGLPSITEIALFFLTMWLRLTTGCLMASTIHSSL